MRTLIVSVALTLSFLSTAHCAPQKDEPLPVSARGTGLFRECKVAVKVSEDEGAHGPPQDIDTSFKCVRYFQGFTAGASISEATGICVGTASIGTVMRIYVKFMEDYPKYMDEARETGAYIALLKAYPCKKTP